MPLIPVAPTPSVKYFEDATALLEQLSRNSVNTPKSTLGNHLILND